MCDAGQASMGYFYFDFRDTGKQHGRDLLSSLLHQLSSRSVPCCDILSRLYAAHDDGARQPSDEDLTTCLKEMLIVSDPCPIYIVIDALDESPDTFGIPCPREQVLTPLYISLHGQSGQKEDIMNYVKSVVYSGSERIMGRWRKEEKDLVIETLTKRADGM